MEWSEETFSVTEIRERCSLPTVARIQCHDRVQSNADLDLYQPLLLYKSYRGVKVQAKLLFRTKNPTGKDGFVPHASISLVIPKGYNGLFALLDENGQSTAKRYMMINDLVKASGQVSSAFLIHSSSVQAFRRISERHYRRTLLAPGTVLQAVGIFTDNQHVYKHSTNSLKQSFAKLFAKHQQSLQRGEYQNSLQFTQKSYLKCLNATNEEFFIPLTTAGNFYLISDLSRPKEYNRHCLHFISTLLMAKKFPSRVRLLTGSLPNIPEKFSGFLQLDSYRICDVILACTIQSLPYQLFEIDVDSEFRFRVTMGKCGLSMEKRISKALAFSKNEADKWRRQIKIAHEVTVDGDEENEEEHIYAEIGPPASPVDSTLDGSESPKDSSKYSSGGSLGSAGNESHNSNADNDTISYRLSVLSHPSRISFI